MKQKSKMNNWKLLLIPFLLLTGCNSIISDCPKLAYYSGEEQDEAHIELSKLNQGNILIRFMNDYGNLRQQVRICNGEK